MLLLLLTERARQSTFWNDRHLLFSSDLWSPNSTDKNRLDHKIWGEMQQQIYQQWRRQLWGTGVRAHLDFQQFHF